MEAERHAGVGQLYADGRGPIEGLYATGVSTASTMGGVYPGAGASVGPSMVYGYISAQDAVAGEMGLKQAA
jgi:succinate dehydrogenase/fumarate reductase flavoprotein subunit